ncbi:unnamed protein product [Didymodactylos carnosus]|nr:unnamed protein product [Didymodactylos carnosus]
MKLLADFYSNANLDKTNVIRLFKLIKALLPQPNKLPVTLNKILKLYDKECLSMTKFVCSLCNHLYLRKRYGQKKCINQDCVFNQKTLKSYQITEVINLDIKSQLETIICGNQNILNCGILFPSADVCYGQYYQEKAQKINTVALNCDGAPLIRTSKRSLWPCFATIMELPPPIREYQRNILVYALWASKTKPCASVFLDETIN